MADQTVAPVNWRPAAALDVLRQRALILGQVRGFFSTRGVLEVETPVISRFSATDPAIESLSTHVCSQPRYLHSSPEFPMKRLLAAGSGDIYQICKVFRDDEAGRHHNPEFTLLEWYRLEYSQQQLIDEVLSLLQTLAVGRHRKPEIIQSTYQALFQHTLKIDPLTASTEELAQLAGSLNLDPGCTLHHDAWLDLLLSQAVCNQFPVDQLTVITDYPASQAALARLNADGQTAARFEIFWGEHELANGFEELTDAAEQQRRFDQDNEIRAARSQPVLPRDDALIAALASGLPACSGVALGIDRLMMKLLNAEHIHNVLAFPEGRA